MTSFNAIELLQLLNELKGTDQVRDWNATSENEEQGERLQESLDDLIGFAALANPGNSLQETETFVGRVAIAKVKLNDAAGENNQSAFIAIGRALEADIKKMLNSSLLVKKVADFLNNNQESPSMFDDISKHEQLELGLMFILAALPVFIAEDNCCDDEEECEDEA